MKRSGFDHRSPANISHTLIKITYNDPTNNDRVIIACSLKDNSIVSLSEMISSNVVQTNLPQIEMEFRHYLEPLLYRINSDQSFFVTDMLTGLNISLEINGEKFDLDDGTDALINRERFFWHSFSFSRIDEGSYKYSTQLNGIGVLDIIFPDLTELSNSLISLTKREYYSADIERLKEERGTAHYLVPSSQYYAQPPISGSRIPIPAYTYQPIVIDRNMPIRDYIDTYRDNIWGREMLYNKISNPEYFLSQEFPNHQLSRNQNSYELKTIPFNGNISADIQLIKRNIKDGITFEVIADYTIDSNKSVKLSTGDTIKTTDLNEQEIEIISPYLSQLITMHRAMGTKLLNFLLIPADVPTILVLRDPERTISEFTSYTDLILMLSHYWEERTVYFRIEQVKKVNNYIELHGFLAASKSNRDDFDFAELRFALDKSFRIDLAMMSLYTNITIDAE
ncbi:MAG: hypothetical protein K0B81_01940 [Candidatus Cloacimonetes bacterium]|nr:hypothetical protein [Candidatus Cloacimonadota bacterium]